MEQFSETRVSEYLDVIRTIVKQGQASGQFRDGIDPTIASKLLFGALDEIVTNWVLSRKRYDLKSAAAPVLDLLFGGLAASTPADGRRTENG